MKTTVEICSSMALILVCLSMFAFLSIAQDAPLSTPDGLVDDVQKCWSSLKSIEGCVVEINRSILTGKVQSLGPACCKAFVVVDEACWPKMFPLNPFFPPLAKSYCASQGGGAVAPVASSTPPTPQTADGISLSFPGLLPPGGFTDNKCWASLQSIEGCAIEIFQSFLAGKIQPLGPACCNAIVAVNDACWPKMFPFNPFFPPLLKSYCAINGGGSAAATPAPAPAV